MFWGPTLYDESRDMEEKEVTLKNLCCKKIALMLKINSDNLKLLKVLNDNQLFLDEFITILFLVLKHIYPANLVKAIEEAYIDRVYANIEEPGILSPIELAASIDPLFHQFSSLEEAFQILSLENKLNKLAKYRKF